MLIGKHVLEFEAPDLIVLRVNGDFSYDETVRMLDVIEEHAWSGPILWLNDVSAAGTVGARAENLHRAGASPPAPRQRLRGGQCPGARHRQAAHRRLASDGAPAGAGALLRHRGGDASLARRDEA